MSWCKSGCLHTNCLCMVFLTRFLTLTVADTVVLHELGTNSDLRSGLAHTLKTVASPCFRACEPGFMMQRESGVGGGRVLVGVA